jgi:hypothetical protein
MHLFDFFKQETVEPPTEVIEAACDLYGIPPESVSSVEAEKLDALSDSLWVIKINEGASAVVAYDPGENEKPLAQPWFE